MYVLLSHVMIHKKMIFSF